VIFLKGEEAMGIKGVCKKGMFPFTIALLVIIGLLCLCPILAEAKEPKHGFRGQVTDLLAKNYGFETYAETELNYSPWIKRGNDDIANISTIGGGLYLSNSKLFLRTNVGAGVNSVSQHLLWSFGTSLEYMMSQDTLLGVYTAVSYDMGGNTRHQRIWLWNGGAIVRTHISVYTPLSFFFKLGVGLFVEQNGPNFYFNLGHASLGISYRIL
jgi:hypothetical protein